MNRRRYLAIGGMATLGGCVSLTRRDTSSSPGEVTCSEDLRSGSSNGPGNGSWPTELHDMQNTGQTDAPGPSGCVETRWTWTQNPEAGMSANAVVSDGQVYVPHQVIDDTSFIVLDSRTGEEQWQYSDYPLVPWFTPTLVGDTLYVVSTSAIDAVNLQSRTSRWHRQFHDEQNGEWGLGVLRVANGLVYVGTWIGTVISFDVQTGEPRWTYDVPGISKAEVPENVAVVDARVRGDVIGPLAVTDQRVYASSWDFSLYALDAETGELHWRFSAGTELRHDLEAPVISDGNVYVQTKDARLFVLDAETGKKQWVFDDIGRATHGVSPVVDDDTVYIVAGTSTENLFLVALDRATQAVRWKRPIGVPFQYPVGDANTIYIDSGRSLYAIDKSTGNEKWKLRLQNGLASPATIIDSAIYVTDVAGNSYGLW